MSESGGNPRRQRVAQTIRDNLAEMIDQDVKDPRVDAVGLVSVNAVELNRDMSIARVYVSFLGAEERQARAAVRGLQSAAKFLRGPLGRRMNLARVPELRFIWDDSPEFQARLTDIVREDEALADDPQDTPAGGSTAEGEEPSA